MSEIGSRWSKEIGALGLAGFGGHAKKKRGGMPLLLKPVPDLFFGENTPSPSKFYSFDKITPLTPKQHNEHLTTITRIPLNPDLNPTTRLN